MNEESKNVELLPCPFCGGEAKYDNSDGYDYIICDECGARNFGFSKEHAFDEWNSRVQCVDDESNYLEKQDSSNKLLEFVKFCRNASATSIRQIHDRARYLIAKHKRSCEKSCKDESATLKTLVHKWTKHSIEDYLYLSVELYKYCVLWFEYWSDSGQLAVCIVNNSSEELLYEDIGVFNTIKEANSKVIEFIKKLSERLVYFAENIRIEE